MSDIKYIYAFAVMMAFASALILVGLPEELQLFGTFDLAFFGAELITITTACVVITGIPCAGVFAFWTVANLLTYVITDQLLKLLIMTPIAVVIIFIIAKLARGSS